MLKDLSIAAVVHGFRSSFCGWCADTGVDFAFAKACLAHAEGNPVIKTNCRSERYNPRIEVMENWAQYLTAGVDGPSQRSPDLASGARA